MFCFVLSRSRCSCSADTCGRSGSDGEVAPDLGGGGRGGGRGGGGGRGAGGGGRGRGRSGRLLDDRLDPGAAGQEQQRRGGKKNAPRHAFTLPDAIGSVRTITVPRSTSDSTS